MDFENRMVNGIHASCYAVSFMKECVDAGITPRYRLCMEWLGTLTVNGQRLSEDDKRLICNLLDNGKMELEHNAKEFLKNKKLSDFDKKYY